MREQKNDLRIVVLPAGWVFIGWWGVEANEVCLQDANCIRRWGTSQGLGELAINGPQKETVLDFAGTVLFQKGTEITSLKVANIKNWKKFYGAI